MDLSRKRDRERLAVHREPYWQCLEEGKYLGFLRGPDTWRARFRGRDKKQQYQPLGANIEFGEAKRRAEEWFAQIGSTTARTVTRGTVRAALVAYVADLRRHGREGAALESEWRFNAVVYKDEIAEVELESATRDDFLDWRDRLLEGRQPRTVNRYVRQVAAGLNKARGLGHVGNPDAWMLTRLSDDVEDEGETAIFLDPAQRRGLIAAASPRAADFMRGMDLTGARPGEIRKMKAGDFDGESVRLSHRKGKPPKLRVRHTVLSREGVAFFKAQTRGKLPAAPLFTKDGEQPWRPDTWADEVRAAIAAYNKKAEPSARIPKGATAYCFRHARISELLQVHGVDPLTVAAQTGTSLAVIEKTYFKFIPNAMREKLAAVKES